MTDSGESTSAEAPPTTRRGRLQRSERLLSDHSGSSQTGSNAPAVATTAAGGGSYSSWEALVRDSFGHVAWPMKITSWELVADREEAVPRVSSSATELISRRGVFSRRHYGSVDQLPQTDLDGLDPNSRRFRLENGESLAEIDEVFGSPSAPILENPEQQTRWYFKYFLGKVHQNYVGIDADKHPFFLSIVSQESGNQFMPLYRVMLFRKEGTQKIALPCAAQQKTTVKQLLAHFATLDVSKTPKELFTADIQKDLLLLEEQEGSVNFKFGVVYMKAGQLCDDDMLSNEHGSEDFEAFLQLLGQRITLRGWERFRGGLDVKGDMTGKQSVYTLYEGHEIMFHVSTLLPFSHDNKQQVERKRHIGNDIVNVVFVDGDIDDADFQPTCIKSQFTHIFAVVSTHRGAYKLAIYCDETVPPFGPTLPNPPYFTDAAAFREFLLVKLINAEKATFQTPTFARKRERTLEMLIKDLYEENVHDGKSNMLNRRAFSEVLYDSPRSTKLKEDARQVEFVRIGQALKLEAIVRGDAPTSLASAAGTASVFRRPPWEPQCFYAAFQARVAAPIVGDSIGADGILVASDEGTYLIRDDQSLSLVFDRTLAVRQISVVEDHGLLLVRGGSPTNKDTHRMYCFRLDELRLQQHGVGDGDATVLATRSRADVRGRRMEKTRGCHLHTVARGPDGQLRMAVAVGRKLLTYQWRYSAAWAAWSPRQAEPKADVTDGWILVREQQMSEVPTILTILESPAERGLTICVGFKNHFELYCAQSGVSTKLHEVESSKHSQTHLVAALDLCDGQETELLLCYNHTCHFQKLTGDLRTTEFDFQWNTTPTAVICAFPYIIGFSGDSMEIRLLVNGNLVHTVTMADLTLVSAKRDIYFATTAPEFIQRDMRFCGVDNEDRDSMCGDLAAAAAATAAGSPRRPSSSASTPDGRPTGDELLPLPCSVASRPEHCIQRARSLQKPRLHVLDSLEQHHKRNICKSVSCTEAYGANGGETRGADGTALSSAGPAGCRLTASAAAASGEPAVPPNTPRLHGGSSITSSDGGGGLLQPNSAARSQLRLSTARLAVRSTSSPFHSYHSDMSGAAGGGGGGGGSPSSSGSSGERVKPLRIFRIPLTNLIGNHAHPYHMRSASVRSGPSQRTGSVSGPHQQQQGPRIVEELHRSPTDDETAVAAAAAAAAAAADAAADASAAFAASEVVTVVTTDIETLSILEPCDRIGMKREKFNDLAFGYGCTEPLFTSL